MSRWRTEEFQGFETVAATAKSLQSCPTLCDPIDGSHHAPPSLGFSRQQRGSGLPFPSPMHESEKSKVKSLSHVWLLATPWTAACQAPPSTGFSRQSTGVGCRCLLQWFFEFSALITMSSCHLWTKTCFFLFQACIHFISFYYLITLVRTSSIMLKSSNKKGHPALFVILVEKLLVSYHEL